ncbi:BglG family transcription antiterminator [Clostridium grantii]|uniref:Transcriptional antiterminator, BglG family n=1 Tax=Clostridium grantii DSM 8605 TaxID=1121316 RepID=A0A1M5Y7P9_9CLOT|nr:BglG family transcription antiterminator [Clostridium grantii]SHI08002.1 transcriptional antiterminator, BglG family [Clostridium grantii DSM 8605]
MPNIKISSRVKAIISVLCDKDGPITVKEISEALDVSSRTILRELSEVESWIKSNGLELNKKPRVGITLVANMKEKSRLKVLLSDEKVERNFSPKERQSLLLNELLQNNEPIKLFYFTTIFNVSEGTISHDLDKVEEWIKNYNLVLIRKQGLGVYIEGTETAFRKAMISLLYEYLDRKQILELINEKISVRVDNNNDSFNTQTRDRLLNLIEKETIIKLEKVVAEAEKNIEYKLTDSAYVGLLVHLALAIKRIKNNENISMKKEVLYELKLNEEYKVAQSIIKKISEEFKIDIPEEEIGYVTMHLKGSKIRNVNQRKEDFSIGNFELIKIANKIIRKAEDLSGYKLKSDKNLLVGLVSHLQPTITRLNMNMDIRNPLLNNIKEKYSEYFEISKQSLAFLQKELSKEIPDSEIGFITMHLGSAIEKAKLLSKRMYRVIVTCTSGIGSSKMLATRLEKEFKNIKIVDVISTVEIDEIWIKENGIDFIISTVQIEKSDIPVINVTPLLIEDDIKKINDFMTELDKIEVKVTAEIEVKKSFEKTDLREKAVDLIKYCKAIVSILDSYFLEYFDKVSSVNELIEKGSLIISDDKVARNTITHDLLNREKSGSTILRGKGIILIHARTSGVESLKLGIVKIKESLRKKDEDIKIAMIMLAPLKVDSKELEIISEISKNLVTNDDFIDALLKDDEKLILDYIKDILNKFLNEKTLGK